MVLLKLNRTAKITMDDIFIKIRELKEMVRIMNEQLSKLDVDEDYNDEPIKIAITLSGDL